MMKVTKAVAAFGYTVNMGKFESARMDISLEAEIGPGEDPEAAAHQLHEKAKGYVRQWVVQQRKEGPIHA